MASVPKGHQWQKQANHFNAVIADMQEIVNDPTSVPQEVAEANQTIQDMTLNLRRLQARGVTPQAQPVEKPAEEKPPEEPTPA